ncbi:hypothetical protein [Streptomyces hydrogenans]|uniref:hypothetical protein n=1 Tax=Streptomyces hydrogenans TaxID=1873719 RepID=UPI00367E3E86
MERQTTSSSRGGTEHSAHRSAALTALGGALIGALSGLLGSGLGYMQGERTQDATATARRADIRRAAYVEYAASCHSFETSTHYVVPLVNAGADKKQKRREVEERFIPAIDRLTRAGMTVRLVGTEKSQALFTDVEKNWRAIAYKVAGVHGKPIPDDELLQFAKEISKDFAVFHQSLEAFLDEAQAEVL